jgi:hypothetical protein
VALQCLGATQAASNSGAHRPGSMRLLSGQPTISAPLPHKPARSNTLLVLGERLAVIALVFRGFARSYFSA